MSTFRSLSGKTSKLLSHGGINPSTRVYVTAAPGPLQDRKKEREAKKEEETQKTIEAMEAVKEGMIKVRDTAEFVKEATAKTAKSVTSMSNKVSKVVSDTTQAIVDKTTESIISDASDYLKDKSKDK